MLVDGQHYIVRILTFFLLEPRGSCFVKVPLCSPIGWIVEAWWERCMLKVWSYYRSSRISFVLRGEVLQKCNCFTQHVWFTGLKNVWVSRGICFKIQYSSNPRRMCLGRRRRREGGRVLHPVLAPGCWLTGNKTLGMCGAAFRNPPYQSRGNKKIGKVLGSDEPLLRSLDSSILNSFFPRNSRHFQ